MKKKIVIFLSLVISGVGLVVPFFASASVLPYFGGFDTAIFPCTCTPGIFWHFFTPLYFSLLPAPTIAGAPLVPIFFGAMAAPPVVAFSTYALKPASYALGTYVPVVQACWVGVPPACYPLPTYGVISPFTGVSPIL